MRTVKTNLRLSSVRVCFALLAAIVLTPPGESRADVAPPVEIRMPTNTAQAVSGQQYEGRFEVEVYRAGTLAGFELAGEGWTVLELNTGGGSRFVQPGIVQIPFRALPANADQPIRLTLTYNGRKVTRGYEIGPAYFARAGRPRPSIRLREFSADAPLDGATEERGGAVDGGERGGAIPLHAVGRIVYTRSDSVVVGVDNIRVFFIDDDDIDYEVIWSGFTDENGYFDTGVVMWDDCDELGCDTPDLVLRYETSTSVVDVTDNSVGEYTYYWETEEVTDFTGSFYDFGWQTPADSSELPALHIFNSIVRTKRFITTRAGYGVGQVQVEWPDDSGGGGAWYEDGPEEIHISTERQWREDTHSHEYGHHFMHQYGNPPEPDYCNGMCDPDPPDDCGHCMWCAETDHDAWNEGFPNWLADVFTRSLPVDYRFDDCTPYQPLFTRDQETPQQCGSAFDDAVTTEGFIGALLRDIEDDTQDDHQHCSAGGTYDPNGAPCNSDSDCNTNGGETCLGDGIMDSLCVGVSKIFDVQVGWGPTTVNLFVDAFWLDYPQHRGGLWPTAFNVSPDFVADFPADTTGPGAVTALDSPTHPLGGEGYSSCITVEWEPPSDDISGACAYSIVWGTDPAGSEPDTTADPVDLTGCSPSATGGLPFGYLGDVYLSIKAQDCAGNWSSQWSTFGPFTIGDCNGNGIADVCEIGCDATALGLPCAVSPLYCDPFPGCGAGEDCNGNFLPDDCDVAGGVSADCNNNGRPDECEEADGTLLHWVGANGSWHAASNWHNPAVCPPPDPCDTSEPVCPALPADGDSVCIDIPNGDITVTYSSDATQLSTLACYESLNIAGGVFPWAQLTLDEPSWVSGGLGLSGTLTVLNVNDSLDVGGTFTWSGPAKLTGAGATEAGGGMQITGVVQLDGHQLALGNFSYAVSNGRIDFLGSSLFQIRTGSTYEHQSGLALNSGWFDQLIDNDGLIVKTTDPGASWIDSFLDNSGEVRVETGTLVINRYSSSTGDFVALPGAVLDFRGGQHELLPASSIVAETVHWTGGVAGANNVWGTYDVSDSTSVTGSHTLTFQASATVLSYGADLYICGGPVYFDAVLGGPINFNSITIACATAYFNSGEPVNTLTLVIGPGVIRGPSEITVSGPMTWNASGQIIGPGIINANGGLLVNPGGGAKTLHDRVFNHPGTATLLGPFGMTGSAVFNNLASGVVDIQIDGTPVAGLGTTLNNAGTIVKTAGAGISQISAPTNNTGTIEVQTGVLEFYTLYSGYYVQTAGQTLLNGGDLLMTGPAPVQLDGGLLTGAGTVTGNVVNAGGAVAPGLSAGVLTVDGNYEQNSNGAFIVELGGLTQGTEYDWLDVTGGATLAGTVQIVPIDGFAPQPGQSFDVITAGSVAGAFDQAVGPGSYQVTYGPTVVTVSVVCSPHDFDCDGDVDADDYAAFADCFSGPGGAPNPTPPTTGAECLSVFDADADNDIDTADFASFQAAFTG